MPGAEDSLPSQRKQATILFADLSGFTAMAETMDPEQVRTVVNQYFDEMTESVKRYGGFVDKYMGDCVMAVFGVPTTHENDPERACRAALKMMGAVDQLSKDLDLPTGKPPTLHIGINTGLVVAAPMGSGEDSRYTIMGDAVNLASRLVHEAEDGEIEVGESTWEPVQRVFEFAAPVYRTIKGKAEKTPTYQLKRAREAQVERRREVAVPMVGRHRELALAEELLDDAGDRRGSLLYVTGEPGIGKSRLVEEIQFAAKTSSFRVLAAVAEPFESMQPYGLWRQILFAGVGVADSATDAEAQETLLQWMSSRSALEPHLPALRATCGFEAREFELLDETSRTRAVELAWKVLLQTLETERPLLLVLDDLQWADPLSLHLIDALGDSLPGLGVVLACVARPEFKHEWSARSYYQQINLRPLTHKESVNLIRELLGEKKIDSSQEQWAAERAEGNPFYVAELARAVAERGTTELPPTVQGIILQRVDQLEYQARQVLEVASVIGREFPEKILRVVAEVKELEAKLNRMQQLELIYEKQIVPELQYIFKHYLTQEATYSSILLERRKQLHRQVAEAIESIYKENLERYYAVLAQHYENAGEFQKAVNYYRQAGERAQQTQSDSAAASLYQRSESALNLLHKATEGSRPRWYKILMWSIMITGTAGFFYFVLQLPILLLKMPPLSEFLFHDWGLLLVLLSLVMVMLLWAVGGLFFYRRSLAFLIYPDKVRITGTRETIQIPFNRIQSVDLIPVQMGTFSGELMALVMALDKRYVNLGLEVKLKGFHYSVKIQCAPRLWRRGYYLDMDDPKQFYQTLTRALERYRAIHVSSHTPAPTSAN